MQDPLMLAVHPSEFTIRNVMHHITLLRVTDRSLNGHSAMPLAASVT